MWFNLFSLFLYLSMIVNAGLVQSIFTLWYGYILILLPPLNMISPFAGSPCWGGVSSCFRVSLPPGCVLGRPLTVVPGRAPAPLTRPSHRGAALLRCSSSQTTGCERVCRGCPRVCVSSYYCFASDKRTDFSSAFNLFETGTYSNIQSFYRLCLLYPDRFLFMARCYQDGHWLSAGWRLDNGFAL